MEFMCSFFFFSWNHEIPLNSIKGMRFLMLRTEKNFGELSSSPVVKIPCFHCQEQRFSLWSGNAHVLLTVKNKIPMGLCSFTPANKNACQNTSDMPKCYINWHYPLLHCHQLLLAKAVENISFSFSRPCPTGTWKTFFQPFVFSESPSSLLSPTSCSLFQQLRNSLHALCISMNGSTGRNSH